MNFLIKIWKIIIRFAFAQPQEPVDLPQSGYR